MYSLALRTHLIYSGVIVLLLGALVHLYNNPRVARTANGAGSSVIKVRSPQDTLPERVLSQAPIKSESIRPPNTSTSAQPSGLVYTVTDTDFKGMHGLEEEPFEFEPPKTAEELQQFLRGTVWSWGSHPSRDSEVVVFIDDETIYGTWGHKYEFEVPEGKMKVEWPEHEVTFSPDFRMIKVEGRNPRVGKLLKRIEGDRLSSVAEDVAGFSKATLKEMEQRSE